MNYEGPPIDVTLHSDRTNSQRGRRRWLGCLHKGLLMPLNIARWLFRPPQQVGEQSKYRKRPTGLSINPFELAVVCGAIGVLILQLVNATT